MRHPFAFGPGLSGVSCAGKAASCTRRRMVAGLNRPMATTSDLSVSTIPALEFFLYHTGVLNSLSLDFCVAGRAGPTARDSTGTDTQMLAHHRPTIYSGTGRYTKEFPPPILYNLWRIFILG